jgi:hypothetical protein
MQVPRGARRYGDGAKTARAVDAGKMLTHWSVKNKSITSEFYVGKTSDRKDF